MSEKQIIPKELFTHPENIETIKNLMTTFLNQSLDIKKVMRTFCIKWLMQKKLLKENFTSSKNNIMNFFKEYNDIYPEFLNCNLPENEFDILGILYQILQKEGNKNQKGSYYTPLAIVTNMFSNTIITPSTTLLDPCCGTGMFLVGSKFDNPNHLYGIDFDEIAVMICKVNLMVAYPNQDFNPNIYAADFLKENLPTTFPTHFDYIITNPPWGANTQKIYKSNFPEISSGESFSYFLVQSQKLLKQNGKLIYLLPESFLNVKVHSDIRKFLLKHMTFQKITLYPHSFSGVLTKFISIELENTKATDYQFVLTNLKQDITLSKSHLLNTINCVVRPLTKKDTRLLQKIFKKKYDTLQNSTWALGIVTGNNKKKLKKDPFPNSEPIYTGKEISAFTLLPYQNYIQYNRADFQQVAPDEIYRANEKLVYKFIAKDLTFAYDNKQSLFLNSANILIPHVNNMSIKTVMAFLNSNVFKYIYRKKFGEIKILKGNLIQLPFPKITENQNIAIEHMVNAVLAGNCNMIEQINREIYQIFSFSQTEIDYIEGEL
ncbi:MAG: N-6 DNA methylase [Clostridia bacterium]|nr:N-6 DNA methylase [Clostridia bacterium]